MKKISIRRLKTLGIAGAAALLCSFSSFADNEDITRFVSGTDVNGVIVEGLTVEEAKTQIENSYAEKYSLTIREAGGKTETINGPEIGYKAAVADGLTAILEQQNASGRLSGPHADNSFEVAVSGSYDQAALDARIQMLACISGEGIVPTVNAHISAYQEGQPFTIVKEVKGNDVDPQKTKDVITYAVSTGLKEVSLVDTGCYRTVTVTSQDESLKQLLNTMNSCRDMKITYVFGDTSEELTGAELCSWITGSDGNEMTVNRDAVTYYVALMAARHDTAGASRSFHTAGGKDVALTGPYGWRLNQEAEIDALINMIKTGQSQTREPLWAQSAASLTGSDWGSTYVEIDLTGQHVYMFQEGNLVWDAPCVTGNVSKGYTTPPGIYSLAYKQTDRILRGAKQADGTYEYESHVDYWMPFNGGIGLHDADWRSKFGGTIYQYGGSHGCVNLPPAKAKVLYELVYKGIPVICYN